MKNESTHFLATHRQAKEKLTIDNLKMEVVADRLRQQCWNDMTTKGGLLTGAKSRLEVWNFPLPPQNETRYKHVAFLRKVSAAAGGKAGNDITAVRRHVGQTT